MKNLIRNPIHFKLVPLGLSRLLPSVLYSLTALVFLVSPCFGADYQETVSSYLAAIDKKVGELDNAKEPAGIAEAYRKASDHIGELDQALNSIRDDIVRRLQDNPEIQIPSISLHSSVDSTYSKWEKQRIQVRSEIKSLCDQYEEYGRRIYQNDINWINNIMRETIVYAGDIGTPDLGDVDVRDRVEDARQLREFRVTMVEVQRRAREVHDEFIRLRDGAFADADAHYQHLKNLKTQFDGVVAKHEAWMRDALEPARVKARQFLKEWEEKGRKAQTIGAQVSQQAHIPLVPVSVAIQDEKERYRLYEEKAAQLSKLVSQFGGEYNQLRSEFAASCDLNNGYTCLDISPYVPAVMPAEDWELKNAGLGSNQSFTHYGDFQEQLKENIKRSQRIIPAIESFRPRFEELEERFRNAVQPILNEIIGLIGMDSSGLVNGLLLEIVNMKMQVSAYVDYFKEVDAKSKLYAENYKKVYDERAADAKKFARLFETETTNALNAASFALERAGEVRAAFQKEGIEPLKIEQEVKNLQAAVKKLYSDGDGSKALSLLEEKRAKFVRLYKTAKLLPNIVKIRDNTYRQIFSVFIPKHSREYQNMTLMAGDPASGVRNPEIALNEKYQELTSGSYAETIASVLYMDQPLYAAIQEINDFLRVAPFLNNIDLRVRSAYERGDISGGNEEHINAMKELSGDREIFSKWLGETKLGGEGYGYKFLAKETFAARDAAIERQSQEQKKKEEKEKPLPAYTVTNVSVNGRSFSGDQGDLILLSNDLEQGKIKIAGWLSSTEGIKQLLFSEDGGADWKGIPIAQSLTAWVTPDSGKKYMPMIKVIALGDREFQLSMAPGPSAIIYKAEDFKKLVMAVITKMADAYEQQNFSIISDLIAQDFLGGKTYLEEGVRFDFEMFNQIRLSISINRIEKRGNLYVAETHWTKNQTVRKNMQSMQTKGNTAMMFVYQDGNMKLQNLRGDLIYATLSSEIAASSGLSQKMIDQIRAAYDKREPLQPGSDSDTEIKSSSALMVRTATITSGSTTGGFDFASGREVGTGSGQDDFSLEINILITHYGSSAQIQRANGLFQDVKVAPDGGYQPFTSALNPGDVYVFITKQGLYGKLEVLAANVDHSDPMNPKGSLSFKYLIQSDGSKNLA